MASGMLINGRVYGILLSVCGSPLLKVASHNKTVLIIKIYSHVK